MLAQALARSEPREHDGDAAANRLALGKAAALAQKKQRRLIPFLEMRHMGPLQINLGRAPGRADFEHRQLAPSVEKGHLSRGSFGLLLNVAAGHNSPLLCLYHGGRGPVTRKIPAMLTGQYRRVGRVCPQRAGPRSRKYG